jgi:hypothetical protein
VETEESDDAYVVRAELPGTKREDVNVELRGNELYLTGEVTEEEGGGAMLRRRQGRFAYRASLPSDADPEKIGAQLADGVLTVLLPKAAQARSRADRNRALSRAGDLIGGRPPRKAVSGPGRKSSAQIFAGCPAWTSGTACSRGCCRWGGRR